MCQEPIPDVAGLGKYGVPRYNVVTKMTTQQGEMMPEIGVRELKARASEIVRAVRDRRARYLVTYRGRPVGVLMPLEEPGPEGASPSERQAVWENLVALGQEIGRKWRSDLSGAEILSEMRR